jgi:hypothetical protein
MDDAANAKVTVVLGSVAEAGAADLVLIEGDATAPSLPPGIAVARFEAAPPAPHLLGCACCRPRPPLARALARLFAARARGEVAFFRRVVLVLRQAADPASVAAAIAADPIAAARFRLQRGEGTAGG